MANFTFPTSFSPNVPAATRTSNLLCSDGVNVGSVSVASILANITNTDLNNANILTNNVQYPTSSIRVHPTGNDPQGTYFTFAAFNVQGTTSQSSAREFLYNIGLTNNAGYDANAIIPGSNPPLTNNAGDKVAFYAGITCQPGGGAGWATNSVTIIEAGHSNGAEPIGSKTCYGYELDFNNNCRDLSNDFANGGFGIAITGASSFTNTAAALVSGVNSSQWQRGFFVANGLTPSGCGFQDSSASGTVLNSNSAHVIGIDFTTATFSSAAMGLKTGQPSGIIYWTNGSAVVEDYVDAALNRFLAVGCAATYVHGQFLLPAVDNFTVLGGPSNRYASVYAINGVIQTSDETLKTNIVQIPDALAIVDSVKPIKFNWKDGKDTSTHWGFSAQNVKQAMTENNIDDFGGLILDDNDTHSLVHTELIPILWKCCQELSAKIKVLESR